ncbi:MAG: bifunctional nuclease family protein [Deltaproteobacteria bacterium]|nr:bifunctional nuclease family protein [Deltaproteobacteria bacterium]
MKKNPYFSLLSILLFFLYSLSSIAGDKTRMPKGEHSKSGVPMLEMVVKDVIAPPGTGEFIVLLQEKYGKQVVPISIGPTEGLVISMRLARQKAPRPLTHDLLDLVMKTLGAHLVKVHVEDLRDQVFLGRIFISRGNKTYDLDARPSDAIAMALGAGVPIFCSIDVIKQTGINMKDLNKTLGPPFPAPGRQKDLKGTNKGESL